MRRLFPSAAILLLSACATAPQQAPTPRPTPVTPAPVRESGGLIGLTAGELVQRFGSPALQVREGPGLKLQFRGRCVLDVYLYGPPQGGGPERVTHVDTRLASGNDTPQAGCIAALSRT